MKKATSVYIDINLVLAMNARGISLSSWINRAMALFLGVPEDPEDELIKKKTEIVVSTLLLSYESEMRQKMKEHASKSSIQDAEKAKEDELVRFGESLKKSPDYPIFKKCLVKKDIENEFLGQITQYINKKTGSEYENIEFWNRAITWFQKYGTVQ